MISLTHHPRLELASAHIHRLAALLKPGFVRLGAETRGLLDALTQPRLFVDEVERMGELLAHANELQASDPVRAQALREQASRMCR